MNDMVLQRILEHPDARTDAHVSQIPAVPIKEPTPLPTSVSDEMTSYDFQQARQHVISLTFVQEPRVIEALHRVHEECLKVTNMSLFNVSVHKCVKQEEFEQQQTQAYEHVNGYLKNQWVPQSRQVVIRTLKSLGKGWYNIKETDQHAYDKGKLTKMFRTIKLIMQDALRSVVLQSLSALTDLVYTASKSVLGCKGWGDAPLNSNHLAPESSPIFFMELDITKEGDVSYTTPVDKFEENLVRLFNNGILATKGMHDMEAVIMNHLFWVGVPELNSVELEEPWVCELRSRLQHCITECIQPLVDYAEQYTRYSDLIDLDVDAYLEAFLGEEREPADIKKECEKHYARKKQVEEEIPLFVDIGMFHVSCDRISSQLGGKCAKLAEKLLASLCERLQTQAEGLHHEFNKMGQVLFARPNGIEDLMDQREFMKGIPDTVKSLEGSIKKALTDWELLDQFAINLSDGNFAVCVFVFVFGDPCAVSVSASVYLLNLSFPFVFIYVQSSSFPCIYISIPVPF